LNVTKGVGQMKKHAPLDPNLVVNGTTVIFTKRVDRGGDGE